MFQKFNENNMVTKFIKNLLATTYVPMVKIWTQGTKVVENSIYITKDYIVKAIENGIPISSTDKEYFKIICPYIKGDFYRGITSNYTSNTSTYDANTHYYLGQYLRMIRDLDEINLMPYYNCWDGTYSDNIRITHDIEIVDGQQQKIIDVIQNNKLNDGLKVLIVPIKFDTTYTIYLNNNMPTELCSVYYDGINIINSLKDSYKKQLRISKSSPITYKVVNSGISSQDNIKEEYLHLLIQLPENNSSSIVVLEGDYTDWKTLAKNKLPKVYFGGFNPQDGGIIDVNDWTIADINFYCKSGISLINTVTEQNYAFSNRLIEYLLLNVITNKDNITDNVKRIQEYLNTYKSKELNGFRLDRYNQLPGIWNNEIRKIAFDITSNSNPAVSFDINGFIDKDTENIILRGKN